MSLSVCLSVYLSIFHHKNSIMSKQDGRNSDSNNNASNNAIWSPKWRYSAMENTGNGVTTEVVMQWVACGYDK